MWVCALECSAHGGQSCQSPEAGVTGAREPPDMGAGNQAQALCKSNKGS